MAKAEVDSILGIQAAKTSKTSKTVKTSKIIKIAVNSTLGIQRGWFSYDCMRFVVIIMEMHWFSIVFNG